VVYDWIAGGPFSPDNEVLFAAGIAALVSKKQLDQASPTPWDDRCERQTRPPRTEGRAPWPLTPTPLSPEPGPDAGFEDIQADIEHTRKELGETIGALSAKADVTGRAKQKATDTKDHITEKASETKDLVVEKAHAAQFAARDAVTDSTGSVKPTVPIAALIAAAAILAISVAVWRHRRWRWWRVVLVRAENWRRRRGPH
jgi:hypothetical protein